MTEYHYNHGKKMNARNKEQHYDEENTYEDSNKAERLVPAPVYPRNSELSNEYPSTDLFVL